MLRERRADSVCNFEPGVKALKNSCVPQRLSICFTGAAVLSCAKLLSCASSALDATLAVLSALVKLRPSPPIIVTLSLRRFNKVWRQKEIDLFACKYM